MFVELLDALQELLKVLVERLDNGRAIEGSYGTNLRTGG